MIIDTHTHFYDPSRLEGVPWPAPDNKLLYRPVLPRHFKPLVESMGVKGAVVVEASSWVEDNQWVLDLAAHEPFIAGLVGHIDPGTEEFSRYLDRFARYPLFRGIRVGALYLEDVEQGSFLVHMERLAKRDLELDVMLGTAQLDGLESLARRLPELRIVINHIAHVQIDGHAPDPVWVEGMRRVAEYPQVYCKVSALVELSQIQPAPADPGFYAPTLEALWEVFGEDRLLYGSNWPVCERSGDYATVHGIVKAYFEGKGEVAAAKFFWKNSQAAYKWVERAQK